MLSAHMRTTRIPRCTLLELHVARGDESSASEPHEAGGILLVAEFRELEEEKRLHAEAPRSPRTTESEQAGRAASRTPGLALTRYRQITPTRV
jgi:hypothetical protein